MVLDRGIAVKPTRRTLTGGGRDRFFGGAGDDTTGDDVAGELLRLVEHHQAARMKAGVH